MSDLVGPRPHADVTWIRVGSSVVILHRSSQKFVELHDTAAELWLVLNSASWDTTEAVRYIVTRSSTDEEEACALVDRYLLDLTEQGLFEP